MDISQDTVRSFVRDLSGMEVQETIVLMREKSSKSITSCSRPRITPYYASSQPCFPYTPVIPWSVKPLSSLEQLGLGLYMCFMCSLAADLP